MVKEHSDRLIWSPAVLTYAQDAKALDDTSYLDLWFLSAAYNGWNDHGEDQAQKYKALRRAALIHLQQLKDFNNNIIEYPRSQDDRKLIKYAKDVLRYTRSETNPWIICHLCAEIAASRALAEAMIIGIYGAHFLFKRHIAIAKQSSKFHSEGESVSALERCLFPQGLPKTRDGVRAYFIKSKHKERLRQSVEFRLPLGVRLASDGYRTSSVIEHLREAKNPLADEHDMVILLCKIEKMLVLENVTPYCLNGQG